MSAPSVCHVDDVCRALRISRRTFHRLRASHQLALVELPRLGRKLRFDGASVDALNKPKWDARRYAREARTA